MTDITSCGPEDAEAWDSYLMEHAQGNFYQRFGWKHINEKNFGHTCYFQAIKRQGKISGLLPVVYVQSHLFGNILCSMPFVNFGGLCADSAEDTRLLLDEAGRLTSLCNADYLEIRSSHSYSDDMPASLHKISMTLDLDADPEVIWNGFKSKHRTNIRRVYKDGVQVKQGRHELLDDFYLLLSKSWKGLGTPIYRKSYFADILNTFPEDTRIFIAYRGSLPIATAFNGYYKNMVEGMWAGALPEHRSTQANYVLYWEMIKDACEKGFQHFHLGRSTADSGAEAFKKKWNAYAKQLYWQYVLNKRTSIPELNVNNPKFDMAIKVWKQLPLPITTTIGPFIARSIP
jgi:FemAB-related protein (PEP-CTERM system-associated)